MEKQWPGTGAIKKQIPLLKSSGCEVAQITCVFIFIENLKTDFLMTGLYQHSCQR